jgi:hypothetical protein
VQGFAYFLYECGDNAAGRYILAVAHESRGAVEDTRLAPPRIRWLSEPRLPVTGLLPTTVLPESSEDPASAPIAALPKGARAGMVAEGGDEGKKF